MENEDCADVDIVITSTALQCLMDNFAPYGLPWSIPVTRRYVAGKGAATAHEVLFFDSPIPKETYTSGDVLSEEYKSSLVEETVLSNENVSNQLNLQKFDTHRSMNYIIPDLDAVKCLNLSSGMETKITDRSAKHVTEAKGNNWPLTCLPTQYCTLHSLLYYISKRSQID